MSWYKDWFDSPLYERIYANRDEREARRLVDWVQNILPVDDYSRVLDLGCGRGRHALNLAECGYAVTGVDLSGAAIDQARREADRRNLENIEFIVGDMRKWRSGTYDAVLNLFTSFGYFEKDRENAKIMENVAQMLRSDGIFLLDYFNSNRVRNQYKPYETGEIEEIPYEIYRYVEEGAIFKEIEFDSSQLNGKTSYRERVKLYDLEWFEKTLKNHRLTLEEVYGDYDGSNYQPEQSSRMIMLARK